MHAARVLFFVVIAPANDTGMGKSARRPNIANTQLLVDRFRQFFSALREYCYIICPAARSSMLTRRLVRLS